MEHYVTVSAGQEKGNSVARLCLKAGLAAQGLGGDLLEVCPGPLAEAQFPEEAGLGS